MSNVDQGRKVADTGAKVIREATERGQAAAEQSAQAAQKLHSMAVDHASAFNVKVIEIAQENTEAFFDFARKIMTTKEPSASMELWMNYLKQQSEAFSKHSRELMTLGQQMASKSADLMPRGWEK